jgi:hypothetical protein
VRAKLIACEVLREELITLPDLARMAEVKYLEQGLHRTPEQLRVELQAEILASQDFDVLLLGYGLCSNGTEGLCSPRARIVIPCLDDCIALFMGSRRLFQEEFANEPGTYYFSRGWVDGATDPWREYHVNAEKYGPETARWVMQEYMKNYRRVCFVHTLPNTPPRYMDHAQAMAGFFALRYEEMTGSLRLLKMLLAGVEKGWNEEFLQLAPGQPVTAEMFRLA